MAPKSSFHGWEELGRQAKESKIQQKSEGEEIKANMAKGMTPEKAKTATKERRDQAQRAFDDACNFLS